MCRLTIASAFSLSLERVIKFVYAVGSAQEWHTLALSAGIQFRLARPPHAPLDSELTLTSGF